MAAPRVSVIIPTWNRAGTLIDAVDSALGQTYGDLEVIVVDDASDDDTLALAAGFSETVRYVRLDEHGGPARAQNAGLAESRGELVAFLADDDTWEPEKLARQVTLVDRDAAIDVVHTGYSIVDETGAVSAPPLAPWQTARGPLFDRLYRGCFVLFGTVLVRRACIERAGGFDERLQAAEDYDLLLRLDRGTIVACVPEPLVRIRRCSDNLSVRREGLVYDVAIASLGGALARGGLGLRSRVRCRTAISDMHTRAAALAHGEGAVGAARRHALMAVARQPLNRRAWTSLPRTLGPARPR